MKNAGEPRGSTQQAMDERGTLGKDTEGPRGPQKTTGTSGETGGAKGKTTGLPNPLHKEGSMGVLRGINPRDSFIALTMLEHYARYT